MKKYQTFKSLENKVNISNWLEHLANENKMKNNAKKKNKTIKKKEE